MRLEYSCGIVSFCPDLRAREATSLPVGVLLVGNLVDSEGVVREGLAAVFVPPLDIGPVLDPMSKEVLMSVADLMRLHVDEVVEANPVASPVEIVSTLHDKLRNSLFVSDIRPERSHDLGLDFPLELLELLRATFADAVHNAGWPATDALSEPERPVPDIPQLHQIHRFDRPGERAARC
jgi:hypothetical protein